MLKKNSIAFALVMLLMMAEIAQAAPKQIIILGISRTDGPVTVQYLLWLAPVSALPRPGAVSQWKGASAAENAAIAAGTVVEVPGSFDAAPGTGKAAIQVHLQAIFTAAQAALISQPQGCFFDGTIWSC